MATLFSMATQNWILNMSGIMLIFAAHLLSFSTITNSQNILNYTSASHPESTSLLTSKTNFIIRDYLKYRKRSVPEFEATLNAMKCALRIVGLQVSEHHNNMIMCCGLWTIKAFMKGTAEKVCENPLESKRVFDDFMTDELIYGKFTHSILGDDTLDCKKYPEGSPTCERLFAFITFVMVMIILLIILLIVGCIMASVCWYRYRRRYIRLLKCKLADLDQTEKDSFLNAHRGHRRKTPKWIKNFRAILPGTTNQQNPKRSSNFNARLPYQNHYNNNHSDIKKTTTVLYKSDSVTIGGKSTPDSALPPSNSNSTSQNTSIASLNDPHHQQLQEKH